jgi:hypothetical protein
MLEIPPRYKFIITVEIEYTGRMFYDFTIDRMVFQIQRASWIDGMKSTAVIGPTSNRSRIWGKSSFWHFALKPHCIRCCHFKVDDVSALEAISNPPVRIVEDNVTASLH